MASFRLNGTPIVGGGFTHPANGNWHLLCQTTDDTAPDGAVTLSLPGLDLAGTVVSAGVNAGRCTVRVVGGAGNLGSQVDGQSHLNATGRQLIGYLLQQAGETFDVASDAPGLDQVVPMYSWFAGSVGQIIDGLCRALGCGWWVTAMGQVHLGVQAFPDAAQSDFLIQDIRGDLRRLDVAMESGPILPNTTVYGQDGTAYEVLSVDHVLKSSSWRGQARYQ